MESYRSRQDSKLPTLALTMLNTLRSATRWCVRGRCTTVVLDNGDRVRVATSSTDAAEDIIGVVRPKDEGRTTAMIGNESELHWNQRWVTDDFGRFIKDAHEIM
jgi:hypothetical protein